jgi:hypothetical protein
MRVCMWTFLVLSGIGGIPVSWENLNGNDQSSGQSGCHKQYDLQGSVRLSCVCIVQTIKPRLIGRESGRWTGGINFLLVVVEKSTPKRRRYFTMTSSPLVLIFMDVDVPCSSIRPTGSSEQRLERRITLSLTPSTKSNRRTVARCRMEGPLKPPKRSSPPSIDNNATTTGDSTLNSQH